MSQCCQNPSVRIAKIRENLASEAKETLSALIAEKDMVNLLENVSITPKDNSQSETENKNNFDIQFSQGQGGNGVKLENAQGESVNLNPQNSQDLLNNPDIITNSPTFRVPANPLLPDEYKEVLEYNDIQFLNGFIRTQIGRYVRVECLIGSNEIMIKTGYLIGVGLNYIILQEAITGNVLSVDFWSIKFIYMYYNEEEAERALAFGPLLNSPLGYL